MIFSPINLEKELRRGDTSGAAGALQAEAVLLLKEAAAGEQRVRETLQAGGGRALPEELRLKLDPSRIFHESRIRDLCVRYRLRFLDSKYFKGEIPYEGIRRIRELERDNPGVPFSRFGIVGPKALFRLRDANADPMLFADLGKGYHYLIHKWGTDLAWHRRLTAFPMRSIGHLALTIALCSLLFCLSFPYEVLQLPGGQSSFSLRGYLFFHSYIGFCGIASFFCFSFSKNFNAMEWDSRHFNA